MHLSPQVKITIFQQHQQTEWPSLQTFREKGPFSEHQIKDFVKRNDTCKPLFDDDNGSNRTGKVRKGYLTITKIVKCKE